MTLPTDPTARKAAPVFSGVFKYFPDALVAIAECSKAGNDQHNPGQPLHWDRSKSTDELDALARHLLEAGTVDTDGILHDTKVAWRALANLQKKIEADREKNRLKFTMTFKGKPVGGGVFRGFFSDVVEPTPVDMKISYNHPGDPQRFPHLRVPTTEEVDR